MAIKFDELLEALDPSLDKFEEDLDSMWIIIPTERRYDDLTADDYFKFAKEYGTFNNQKDCFDKIEELAPDRWDAFIPMRIEGVNESLNEAFNINDSFKFNSDKKTIDFISKLENYFIKKGINAYSAYDMASNLWKINIDKKEFVLTISDPVFHLYTTNNNRPLHNWSNMYYDDLLKDCIYAIESNL